jgi:hypothetical protein
VGRHVVADALPALTASRMRILHESGIPFEAAFIDVGQCSPRDASCHALQR